MALSRLSSHINLCCCLGVREVRRDAGNQPTLGPGPWHLISGTCAGLPSPVVWAEPWVERHPLDVSAHR